MLLLLYVNKYIIEHKSKLNKFILTAKYNKYKHKRIFILI